MDMKAYDLVVRFVELIGDQPEFGVYTRALVKEAKEYLATALPTEEEYRKAEENC